MPPAARVGDMHTCPMQTPGTPPIPHVGGPILPPGAVTVLIGGQPAARVGDMCTCVGPPDTIAKGSPTVKINYMMAARIGDTTAHGGSIVLGFPTVIIGEAGGGASGPGGGGGGGGANSVAAGMSQSGLSDSDSANASVDAQSGGVQDAGAAADASATPQRSGYATQDEAANAALTESNPQSIQANREYGGQIYQDSDGTYGYSTPIQGGDQGVNPGDSPAPDGTTVVGDYHTHGDYSTAGPNGEAVRSSDPAHDDFNSDHFSTTDKQGIASDGANTPGYKGYLGTPSGTFRSYDAQTGQEGTL